MKDTIKIILVGFMSFVAIARNCVKTSVKVADVSEPIFVEARYMKNAVTLEKEGENSFSALKTAKTAKDVKDIIEITQKLTEKDSLKTNVKPVNAHRK